MTTVSHVPPRALANPADAPHCEHCGTALEARTHSGGRRKRFCNNACRMAARKASQRAEPSPSSASGAAWALALEGGGGPGLAADPEADATLKVQSEANRSWYYAKFASTPGQVACGPSRRAVRYALRQLLTQVSEIDRCKRCGRDLLGGAAAIVVNEGTAHFSGVETCGRIWLCPVCAAKIRARRGDEIAEAVGRHIERGGGAYFATSTLSHDQGDALAVSLDVLTKSWRSLMSGRAYQEEKDRFGILGNIAAKEITHGRNGWHPHIHGVVMTETEVDVLHLCDWFGRLDARWSRALVRHGWTPGLLGRRFTLYPVTRSPGQLAAYVTKVQESGLGNEIARADLKSSRQKSSRTPLQILADFGTDGLASDLDLWHEYERATVGKSAIRWSRGLRKLLLPDVEEQTDEEIAAEEIGGDTVAYLLPGTWYRLADIPGAQSAVLDAVELDGWEGLIRTLIGYRVGVDGLLTPDEYREIEAGTVLASPRPAAVVPDLACHHRQPCRHGC
jgi:hypothetical protein